jgi:hypothetical protein
MRGRKLEFAPLANRIVGVEDLLLYALASATSIPAKVFRTLP